MADFLKNREVPRIVVADSARTSTDNSGTLKDTAQSLPMYPANIVLILDCDTVTGTSPTLDLTFEMSPDGGTTWFVHSAFTQVTAAAELVARFRNYVGPGDAAIEGTESGAGTFINCPYGQDHRFQWTIGGTNPSFTFAVYGIFQQAF